MLYFQNAVVMLPLAAIISALIYLPFYLTIRRKQPFIKHLANFMLVGYFVMLAWAVFLWRGGFQIVNGSERIINLQIFYEVIYAYQYDGGLWSSQVMWNVVMFVPLGFLLPCVFKGLRRGTWKTILLCFGFTLIIETVQYFIGRCTDVDDVLANLTGGVMGHAVYIIFCRLFDRVKWAQPLIAPAEPPYRRALAWITVALVLGVPTIGDIILKLFSSGIIG